MTNRSKKPVNYNYKINFWGFLEKVLVAALNKGQLIGMTIALIFIILIIKIPNDQILPFIEKLLDISKINSILGWILSGFITFGSFLTVRWQRRIHTKEIQRISKEKKILQEKLTEQQLPSSNKE
jgi:hypothetical protein